MGDHHQEIHLDVPLTARRMGDACLRQRFSVHTGMCNSLAAGFKPISLARATAHSFCRKCGCVWTSILLGNSQKVRWGNEKNDEGTVCWTK